MFLYPLTSGGHARFDGMVVVVVEGKQEREDPPLIIVIQPFNS
jgi:hypothetical protein